MILEPRATLQGVRIPSAVLKMVFRHIFLVLFLMQFGIWRAAAFVSSRINLLYLFYVVTDGHRIYFSGVGHFVLVNDSDNKTCITHTVTVFSALMHRENVSNEQKLVLRYFKYFKWWRGVSKMRDSSFMLRNDETAYFVSKRLQKSRGCSGCVQ